MEKRNFSTFRHWLMVQMSKNLKILYNYNKYFPICTARCIRNGIEFNAKKRKLHKHIAQLGS